MLHAQLQWKQAMLFLQPPMNPAHSMTSPLPGCVFSRALQGQSTDSIDDFPTLLTHMCKPMGTLLDTCCSLSSTTSASTITPLPSRLGEGTLASVQLPWSTKANCERPGWYLSSRRPKLRRLLLGYFVNIGVYSLFCPHETGSSWMLTTRPCSNRLRLLLFRSAMHPSMNLSFSDSQQNSSLQKPLLFTLGLLCLTRYFVSRQLCTRILLQPIGKAVFSSAEKPYHNNVS